MYVRTYCISEVVAARNLELLLLSILYILRQHYLLLADVLLEPTETETRVVYPGLLHSETEPKQAHQLRTLRTVPDESAQDMFRSPNSRGHLSSSMATAVRLAGLVLLLVVVRQRDQTRNSSRTTGSTKKKNTSAGVGLQATQRTID